MDTYYIEFTKQTPVYPFRALGRTGLKVSLYPSRWTSRKCHKKLKAKDLGDAMTRIGKALDKTEDFVISRILRAFVMKSDKWEVVYLPYVID